ncbi:hypothetical protein CONLIGDRAFT_285249 [Coniochaeta ligniaria NRRL 30616]|uniref:Uncharacterized protein n=1 Tax=Coniochaeta ligniaria NRRL 30616 TaxID=1408157 RepID=A0A1J7JLA1_9PEZI|nr:hypothetical protein CONLIGDRAFT_285249 [Coniochaeta ligniaria NRRL 30616]
MEGSYDPVFHQSSSSNPTNPSGAASQYKANVNRTKTRKWVEAKTVDYGGDDWGGDYDDEPDEPEPEPLPPPKPQGPRPSATFSNSQPPSPAGPRPLQTTGVAARAASPAVSSSPGLRTPVGAPPLHIQTQQQPGTQPAAPETDSPWRQGPPSRGSTPGIERQREMSPHAVGVPQSAATSSVYSAVAEFGQMYGDRGASPGPFQGQRQRRMSPGPQSASSPVPTRFPRRKSSLGQHDAPADTLYSPVHGDNSRQMGSRPGSSHANAGPIMSPNKPWMVEGTVGGPRSASPSGSMRSPITTGKPLPFVRPADIYRKLEDEKEKVRRSIDSGRPSMDSLGLGRGSDTAGSLRTQSPARTSQNTRQTQEQGQVRPDSDVILREPTGVVDVPFTEEVQVESKGRNEATPGRDDDETIMPRSGRSGLPTVAERKSEYGIEGLIASYEARGGISSDTSQPDASPLARIAESGTVPASHESVPAISSATPRLTPRSETGDDRGEQVNQARERQELDKTEGVPRDETLGSRHSHPRGGKEGQEGDQLEDLKKVQSSGEELRRLSTSPKLPELGRLSVFGLDLFPSSSSSDPPTSSSLHLSTSSPPPPVPSIPLTNTILIPNSPLSTVLESPASSPPLPQDAGVGQTRKAKAQEGQASRDQHRPGIYSGSGHSTPQDAIPKPNDASSGTTTWIQPAAEPDEDRDSETASSDSAASLAADRSSTGDRAPTSSSQRPQSGPQALPTLHAGSDPVTSKSESEQVPSIDKALPALPSEVSVVTPDPQASQLAISAPTPIVSSEQGSSEGDKSKASSTTNTKLAVHPLLKEHSEQAKAMIAQVSTGSSTRATSASVLPPAPASKLTPVDNQVLPQPNLPGSLSTDYESYLPSAKVENATQPSMTGNQPSDVGEVQVTTPQEPVGELSHETTVSPPQPLTAPPLPPGDLSRGETYVTALESPLSDSGSPTKSDELSAQILRSLSPTAPNTNVAAENSEAGNRSSAGPSGDQSVGPSDGHTDAARESTFLPDLYDDYWSFAGDGNANDATPALPVMPAALNVQSEETRPRVLHVVNDENIHNSPAPTPAAETPRSSVDVYKTDVQAVTVELHRPVLPNRFSWERDGIEAAKVDIQAEPKSLADKPQTSATVGTPSTDMDVKSNDHISEATGTASPAQDKGKGVVRSRSPSPSLTIQQPRTTMMPPTLGQYVSESTSQDSIDHPGPLTSNPVMTFREIMEVPSQADRIREFQKARSHYAAAETGLETILENLVSQHPDIAEASRAGGPTSPMYTYDAPSIKDVGGLLSPTAPGTAPASARHHSTAHIGPKTKEFFASAGKASKGLFSTLKAKGKKVAN